MDAVTNCSVDMFRRHFIAALVNIGIGLDDAQLFCCMNQSKRLKDYGMCNTISIKIDEFMERRIPGYKGFTVNDTWSDIVKYNFNDD